MRVYENEARPSSGLCVWPSIRLVLPARLDVVPGPGGIGGPPRTLIGALADIANALSEAVLGLVEIGGADAVGWRQIVVFPAEEVGLVAFLDMVAVGAHDIDVCGPAVGGRDGAIDLAQELARPEWPKGPSPVWNSRASGL